MPLLPKLVKVKKKIEFLVHHRSYIDRLSHWNNVKRRLQIKKIELLAWVAQTMCRSVGNSDFGVKNQMKPNVCKSFLLVSVNCQEIRFKYRIYFSNLILSRKKCYF
jgi:hypothetical protein